jgi:hypothetical protein
VCGSRSERNQKELMTNSKTNRDRKETLTLEKERGGREGASYLGPAIPSSPSAVSVVVAREEPEPSAEETMPPRGHAPCSDVRALSQGYSTAACLALSEHARR